MYACNEGILDQIKSILCMWFFLPSASSMLMGHGSLGLNHTL